MFFPSIDEQNQAEQSLAFAWPLLGLCLTFAWPLLSLCSAFAQPLLGLCSAFAQLLFGLWFMTMWRQCNITSYKIGEEEFSHFVSFSKFDKSLMEKKQTKVYDLENSPSQILTKVWWKRNTQRFMIMWRQALMWSKINSIWQKFILITRMEI